MSNLVDNPKLLNSTKGDIQVMDSWGNTPVTYPGGAGQAPDNWWTLGGPDYGTFLSAGGVWSTRTVGGGRSIMLDAAAPLVQNSGGITQVVPVLQESIKPIRFTASVAAEGCLGQPNVEVICIGYPPGYPGVGSADLFFDTGTYDFVQKRTTIVPTQKVKYLFFHLLHLGFTAGKTWYGGFSVEEIDMPQADIPTDNLTINPNFTYSPDGIVPTAWNTAKCTLVDELSPVGVTSLQMLQGGTLSQRDVIISRGKLKHEVTVHVTAPAATQLKLTARLRGRYRTIISENSAIVQVGNSWTTRKITLLGTTSSEKVDVEVELLSGAYCYIGAVFLTSSTFTPSLVLQVAPAKTTVNLTTTAEDSTQVVSLGGSKSPGQVEFVPGNYKGDVYLCNGLMGNLAAASNRDALTFLQEAELQQLSDTEYTLAQWQDGIQEVTVGGREVEQLLRIPHLSFVDFWQITAGGAIPGGETRYYLVTAYNDNGETDRSNEIRAITDEATNTNRVPLEITPVEGAKGYRVYMTQSVEDDTDPEEWIYAAHYVKKLKWDDGLDHLLFDVTAQQLRDAGYLLYDDGQACTPGVPPAEHTAPRWIVDTDNQKVVFDLDSAPGAGATVKCSFTVNENINAIIYTGHAGIFYVAGDAGIYQSDTHVPETLRLVLAEAGIIDLDYYGGTLWYLSANGDVKNLAGQSYPGAGAFTGFCWVKNSEIARITAGGTVQVFDLTGNLLRSITTGIPDPDFIGLTLYFGQYVTFNRAQDRLVCFDAQGNIIKAIDEPVIGMTTWGLQGVNLVTTANFGVTVFRILADTYYFRLDQGDHIDANPKYPDFDRPQLPDEVEDPEYPELLANGTFEDGTTFPTGFNVYMAPGVKSDFSSEVAVSGTRAIYFWLPQDAYAWGSLNKYDIPIIGGRQYVFSFHQKATASAVGGLNVTWKDRLGQELSSPWWYFTFDTTYTLEEFIAQAPVEAVAINFRIMEWGTDQHAITYFLNALSVKEESAPEQTFEHIFNGTFAVMPPGATMPSGWELTGESPGLAEISVVAPAMQQEGKALRIDLLPLDQMGWVALQSQPFAVTAGDALQASFYFRRGQNVDQYFAVTIYYLQPDGGWGVDQSVGVNISDTATGSRLVFNFPPNPDGYPTARLRIWPEYGDINWIEDVSIVPLVDPNRVVNPEFLENLSGWDVRGYDMSDNLLDGLGTTIDTGVGHDTPKSALLSADYQECKYTELRQYLTFNQEVPTPLVFNAWARGSGIIDGWGELQFSIIIDYGNGNLQWDPFGSEEFWPKGSFDWTEKQLQLTTDMFFTDAGGNPLPVVGVYLNFNLVNWGLVQDFQAWVDGVRVYEQEDPQPVDGITLDVPYTDLSVDTVPQLNISGQLTHAANPVEQANREVTWSADPDIGSFQTLPTNSKGRSRAIYTLPDRPCQVTITATMEAIQASETVTIHPLVDISEQELDISGLPASISTAYVEVIAPKSLKPLPDVTERIGRWEVFRPTYYNMRQMLDYDIHYSPQDWAVDQNVFTRQYPKQAYFFYKDWLSDYPNEVSWGEIMSQRPEWFCFNATGLSHPFADRRYEYDWGNLETCQWYLDRCLRLHPSWSDGLYIDDYGGETSWDPVWQEWETKASYLLNFRTIKERHQAQARFLNIMRERLHKRGKYLTCNQGATRRFLNNGNLVPDSEMIVRPFDGQLLEVWCYESSQEPQARDVDYFRLQPEIIKSEIDFIKWCGDNDQFVVALARSGPQCWEARMFSLAAFLMVKHAHAYYMHSGWNRINDEGEWLEPYGDLWHPLLLPEMVIRTGQPAGNYQLDNWLFFREFENCIALLNIDTDTSLSAAENIATKAKTYTLPAGTWYSMRGQQYSGEITVGWRQGLVLVKERP